MTVQLSPADMDRLSKLMMKLSHDPNTRREFAGLVGKVDKEAVKAFADVTIEEKFDAFTKKFEDDRTAEKMQYVAARRAQHKNQVVTKRRLTKEQVEAVDKIAQHYNLGDWEAAADIYATRNPPPRPDLKPPPEIEYGSSTWEFPTVPGADGKMLSFKDFRDNVNKATRDAAIRTITDFKRNRLPQSFQAA